MAATPNRALEAHFGISRFAGGTGLSGALILAQAASKRQVPNMAEIPPFGHASVGMTPADAPGKIPCSADRSLSQTC